MAKNLADDVSIIPVDTRTIARRTNYNTLNNRKVHIGKHFQKPSLTQQQFAYETDLNNIVDKNMQFKDPAFLTKLQLMHSTKGKVDPIYGDFSDVPDYKAAKDALINSKKQFDTLPAAIRKRFDNNPLKLLEFVNDEANYDEGVKLGIFGKKAAVETTVIPENPQGSSQTATSGDVPEGSAQSLT